MMVKPQFYGMLSRKEWVTDKPFMHFNLQEFFGGIILLEEDKDDLELSLLIKKLMILLRIFLMRNL
jgi:hypothetical protein